MKRTAFEVSVGRDFFVFEIGSGRAPLSKTAFRLRFWYSGWVERSLGRFQYTRMEACPMRR